MWFSMARPATLRSLSVLGITELHDRPDRRGPPPKALAPRDLHDRSDLVDGQLLDVPQEQQQPISGRNLLHAPAQLGALIEASEESG